MFALIVGINKYKHESIPDLGGAVPDANEMKRFLSQTLHVSEDRIWNLRDEEATKKNIETKLRSLANNPDVARDEPILIYYAGHGAEIAAPPTWPSSDGKIQMLLPHDFSYEGTDEESGQGVLDITLSRILQDLARKKGDNITVILDSCHSGSATRDCNSDKTLRTRGVVLPPKYTISSALNKEVSAGATRSASIVKGFEHAGLLSHVLLAACSKGQTAKERNCRGDFTSELLNILREKGIKDLSYKEIIERVGEKLSEQYPQCEGNNMFRSIFDLKAARKKPTLYPVSAISYPYFTMAAGHAHGVEPDAEFAVYADKGATRFIGMLKATKPEGFVTIMTFAKGWSFELLQPAFALQTRAGQRNKFRLLVRMSARYEPDLLKISEEMQRNDPAGDTFTFLANDRESPDLVTTIERGRARFEIRDAICLEHGLQRLRFDIGVDVKRLSIIFQDGILFFWHLRRWNAITSDKYFKLSCRRFIQDEEDPECLAGCVPDLRCPDLNVNGKIVLPDEHHDRDKYGFEITNNSARKLYAALFYFDMSDLSIALFYKPGCSKKGTDPSLSPNGGMLSVGGGDSGVPPRAFDVPEKQNIDIGYLKLFLSTEALEWSDIAQNSPFTSDEHRGARMEDTGPKPWFGSIIVPVVQRRNGYKPQVVA